MAAAAQLIAYRPDHAPAWDRLVEAAHGGTALHSRRFLDYHGTRFRDLSFVAMDPSDGAMNAVFPLAADLREADRVVSHPGSSFGGLVTLLREPVQARAILAEAARQLRDLGFRRLLVHLTPPSLLRQPDDGLLPRLIRLGQVTQLDLWSVLALGGDLRKRGYWRAEIRKAARKGLRADPASTPEDWAALHAVVSTRLQQKYGRGIVHSAAELIDLHHRLGPQSRGLLVRDGQGAVLAGLWFIDYGTGTLHNQYIGASEAGLAARAPTFGLSVALEAACAEGFRLFSFGRSTLEDGWSENQELVRFKSRFGAGLVSQFHIEVDLDALIAAGV